MQRLLCIVGSMNAGGAETFLMKIYRQIEKLEYQFDFCINTKGKNFYEDEIKSFGGLIFYIPAKSENIAEYKKQLYAIVKNNGYKYVLRITSNAMGFMDLKIAKAAGAKRCIVRSSNSQDGSGLKIRCAHWLGLLLYSQCVDVKMAPSDLAAKHTFGKRAYEKGDVKILHNALDLNQFYFYPNAKENIRKEFNIDENTVIIGHIGRFMTQKNHKFLVKVFFYLQKQIPDAVLLLVGTGELEEDIKQEVKTLGLDSKVIFTGVRKDIPQLLSAMDVMIFPSLYEGMPNVIIEAQATGLPCVISDTITAEANITGLVEYKSLSISPDGWADTAIKLLGHKRKDTKEDFLKNKYDIESVTNEFVNLVFQ